MSIRPPPPPPQKLEERDNKWKNYYIPYKRLIIHLKSLHSNNPYTNPTIESSFLSILRTESEKVSSYYKEIYSEMLKRYKLLSSHPKKTIISFYKDLQRISHNLNINISLIGKLLKKYEQYYSTTLDIGDVGRILPFIIKKRDMVDDISTLMKEIESFYSQKYTKNNNTRNAIIDLSSYPSSYQHDTSNTEAAKKSPIFSGILKNILENNLLIGFCLGTSFALFIGGNFVASSDKRLIPLLSPLLLWNLLSPICWIFNLYNIPLPLHQSPLLSSFLMMIFFIITSSLECPLKNEDILIFLIDPSIIAIILSFKSSFPILLLRVFLCPVLGRRYSFMEFFLGEQMISIIPFFREIFGIFAYYVGGNVGDFKDFGSIIPPSIRITQSMVCFINCKKPKTSDIKYLLNITKYLLLIMTFLLEKIDGMRKLFFMVKIVDIIYSCTLDIFCDWDIIGPRWMYIFSSSNGIYDDDDDDGFYIKNNEEEEGVVVAEVGVARFHSFTFKILFIFNFIFRSLPLFSVDSNVLLAIELIRRSLWNIITLEVESLNIKDDGIIISNCFIMDIDVESSESSSSSSDDEDYFKPEMMETFISNDNRNNNNNSNESFDEQFSILLSGSMQSQDDDDDENRKPKHSLENTPPSSPILKSGWMSPNLSNSLNRERSKTA